jgi:hypothetical protein
MAVLCNAPVSCQGQCQSLLLLQTVAAKAHHARASHLPQHTCVQAPLLAHTMLHHPRAWPKQEAALGLLITLRKYFQHQWVRCWRHNPLLHVLMVADVLGLMKACACANFLRTTA